MPRAHLDHAEPHYHRDAVLQLHDAAPVGDVWRRKLNFETEF
jgi:hypothetical protein